MLPVAHVNKKLKLSADGVCAVPTTLTLTRSTLTRTLWAKTGAI